MARQIKNILVGVGKIEANDTSGDTFQASGFYDLGFTIDGVEITMEPDIVDIVVDQLGDAAKLIKQSAKVMVKTTMAEATLENLALAWGYAANAVSTAGSAKTFKLAVFDTGIPNEKSLRFTGKSPDGLARVYTSRRVVSVSAVGTSYKRGEATVIPVEFRVLPDANMTGSEYGTIVDTLP